MTESVTTLRLPFQEGRPLLLLADLLDELAAIGIDDDLLLRASEQSELSRLLEFGTTRGGYAPGEKWRDGSLDGRVIAHEDVLFATTPDEIRAAEADPARSSSFKKLPGMVQPMVQVYARSAFEKIADRQHRFRNPADKRAALRAVVLLERRPALDGWFSDAAGLAYRELLRPIRGGTVVEVGVWAGRSLSWVGRLARRNGTRVIGIDHWAGSSDAFDARYRELLAAADIEGAARADLAALGLDVELRHAESIAAARSFAPDSVDLVFLDASHDAAAVAADLRAWAPVVKDDGRLAGHDYAAQHPGVIAAVDAYAAEVGARVCVDPSSVWWLAPR